MRRAVNSRPRAIASRARRAHRLIEIDWPDFGLCDRPPPIPVEEFEERLAATLEVMARLKLSHLVVYGDREHFANLAYLTGFDPRFEEALLILREDTPPLLLVGNECVGHVPVSPLHGVGKLRAECYQPFSLLNQPRNNSRKLDEIFQTEGVDSHSRVGCVGWKYFGPEELSAGSPGLDVPSYLADALRALAGSANVINATAILMNPEDGLRTSCSAAEIAYFEYTSVLASEGVKRMIFGARDGMVDHELVRLAGLNGEPLGAHPSIKTATTRHCSLMSPVGGTMHRGDPLSMGLCYWGSNCCRAGWLAAEARDLPSEARDYVAKFAGPYFAAVGSWMEMIGIGASADRLTRSVMRRLPFNRFGVTLNPGHLIHLDEWLSSPFFLGSPSRLRSGMVIQTDIIPQSRVYFSSRMEDGIVLADASLRLQLERFFPDCFARCQARRAFMRDILGIALADEVLPLSNMPGIVPPFFLRPNFVLAFEP